MVDSFEEIIGTGDPRALEAIRKLGEDRDPESFNMLIRVIEVEAPKRSEALHEAVSAMDKYRNTEGLKVEQYGPYLEKLQQVIGEHGEKMMVGDAVMLGGVYGALKQGETSR